MSTSMTTELEALRAERDALAALVERQREAPGKVSESWASFERYGAECTFEGGPMISASVLEGLQESAAAALALTPPAALAERDVELLERMASQLNEKADVLELWGQPDDASGVLFAAQHLKWEAARLRAGAEGEG